MLEVGRMEGAGETGADESANESASHFAAWSIVSAPLVLGFDLTNATRLELAWPTISNALAINVSQSWEAGTHAFQLTILPVWPTSDSKCIMMPASLILGRADPSGSLLKSWQGITKESVVIGCGNGCSCEDKNPKCREWAKQGQCQANPGYMSADCAASCPSTSNSSGWKLPQENADSGAVVTPSGKCLDTAGQLTPAPGSGLNWLRTADCDASSTTQKWRYVNNTIKSTATGQCVGVQSHWLWGQPMVSMMSCANVKQSGLTLHGNGTLSSMSGYGCLGTDMRSVYHGPGLVKLKSVGLLHYIDHSCCRCLPLVLRCVHATLCRGIEHRWTHIITVAKTYARR